MILLVLVLSHLFLIIILITGIISNTVKYSFLYIYRRKKNLIMVQFQTLLINEKGALIISFSYL